MTLSYLTLTPAVFQIAFAKPWQLLFHQSQGIPQDWKCANICALFKKGRKCDVNSYRPVSLTSHVAKVMETLILNYLLAFCEHHNLFSCQQRGFRAHYLCVSNLLECLNAWTQGFDNPRTGTDIIYTYFRKAFDSVSHKRLAYRLELYGISGSLL